MTEPFLFYTHREAFTPRKTELLLELLSLPFTTVYLEWKGSSSYRVRPPKEDVYFAQLNPSGHVPFLYDPGIETGVVESNAMASISR